MAELSWTPDSLSKLLFQLLRIGCLFAQRTHRQLILKASAQEAHKRSTCPGLDSNAKVARDA